MKQSRRTWLKNLGRGGLVGMAAMSPISIAKADETAWTNGDNGTWRFIIMGDHRCVATKDTVNADKTGWSGRGVNVEVLQDLAGAVKKEGAAFVLEVGDMVAKYDKALLTGITADALITTEMQYFTQLWNELSADPVAGLPPAPIYPVRGNHEASASAAAYLEGIKGLAGISGLTMYSPPGEEGLTYAFSYKNCLFVALDLWPAGYAKLPTLSANTQAWLNELFANSDRPHVFVWGHTPAYEVWDTEKAIAVPPVVASRDGLASPKGGTGLVDQYAALNVRNPFWNLLGGEGANYYCGHDHLYLRGVALSASGNPVIQTIIGNGGAPAYPKYPADPFVESSASTVENHGSPRITKQYMDQDGSLKNPDGTPKISYGYLLVEVHGSHVTVSYKAENQLHGTFKVRDTWTWKINDKDPEEEGTEAAVLVSQ